MDNLLHEVEGITDDLDNLQIEADLQETPTKPNPADTLASTEQWQTPTQAQPKVESGPLVDSA